MPRATWLTLAAMSLGFGVVQLDVTIVNTTVSSIGASLGGGVTQLQWVVSAYTIAFAGLILAAGALGDRIGAKRTFMAGFAIFTLASLGCALAPSISTLIAARALQGLGAAVLVPNSLALLNHAYPDDEERGKAVGIWAAGASFALTAGPLAGGSLVALVGWRSIFLVNLPIGLAGLWLTWRHARETAPVAGREFDVVGQLSAIGALACLASAVIEGAPLGWTNPWVVAGLCAFVALTALFVFQERRARQPMLPLALFRNRLFSLALGVGLLANIAFYGLIFVLSLYFQKVDDYSPFETGLAFLPMMGAIIPLNLLAARASARFGAPAVISIGAATSAAGCIALCGIARGTSYRALCAPLIAIGAGLGFLVPPLTSMLLGSVEKARSGIAAGVLNATRQTGSVVGVALFGSLFVIGEASSSGVRASLVIAAALLLVAATAMMAASIRRSS